MQKERVLKNLDLAVKTANFLSDEVISKVMADGFEKDL